MSHNTCWKGKNPVNQKISGSIFDCSSSAIKPDSLVLDSWGRGLAQQEADHRVKTDLLKLPTSNPHVFYRLQPLPNMVFESATEGATKTHLWVTDFGESLPISHRNGGVSIIIDGGDIHGGHPTAMNMDPA